MRYVIYKQWNRYYITTEENFRAPVRNVSQTLTLHDCYSFDEALTLARQYFKDVEIINGTGE